MADCSALAGRKVSELEWVRFVVVIGAWTAAGMWAAVLLLDRLWRIPVDMAADYED